MGYMCGVVFLKRNIVESAVMWLQQPESKYQELPEVANIALDGPDKTSFTISSISLLVTGGVGLEDY